MVEEKLRRYDGAKFHSIYATSTSKTASVASQCIRLLKETILTCKAPHVTTSCLTTTRNSYCFNSKEDHFGEAKMKKSEMLCVWGVCVRMCVLNMPHSFEFTV